MFKHIRKLMLENRLARLEANGKDNKGVRNKLARQIRNI